MSPVMRALLTDHIASLEGVGFGSDSPINGADAIDAVNLHFAALRDALAAELPYCSVCGDQHDPLCHSDELPEPGDIRETGP